MIHRPKEFDEKAFNVYECKLNSQYVISDGFAFGDWDIADSVKIWLNENVGEVYIEWRVSDSYYVEIRDESRAVEFKLLWC